MKYVKRMTHHHPRSAQDRLKHLHGYTFVSLTQFKTTPGCNLDLGRKDILPLWGFCMNFISLYFTG